MFFITEMDALAYAMRAESREIFNNIMRSKVMGKYTIVINGEGKHHSDNDQQTDANKVALDMVSWLKKQGHTIHSAVFNHSDNSKTDDLHEMTKPVEEAEAVEAVIDPNELSNPVQVSE